MTTHPDTAVWWVKRDFRLSDNEALTSAASHQRLLVIFIAEPSVIEFQDSSAFHWQAQLEAAKNLQLSLRQMGGELFFSMAEAIDAFEAILSVTGHFTLYAHQETGNNLTFERDKSIRAWCKKNNLKFEEKNQNGVVRGPHDREERPAILAQRLLQTIPLPQPTRLPPPPELAGSITRLSNALPQLATCGAQAISAVQLLAGTAVLAEPSRFQQLQELSETSAKTMLQSFLYSRGINYSGGISSPNNAFEFGSRLSTHLAWGTLSLRTVFAANAGRLSELRGQKDRQSARWRKSLTGFQSRLYWHDHFIQRFESACQMEFEALNPAYQTLAYPQSDANLQAWLTGTTGIPLVDACIRCLHNGGFLNFRMRAMLVSVACYGLGLHWKSIQYPLARLFYDYEPGIHFSQIQMQAGVVGINTIRVYNPHKQLIEQDPECKFVRAWVEELSEFNAEQIANYQTQPLGDYPPPPIDFDSTAKLMKDRIFRIRNSEEGKAASQLVLAAYGSRRGTRRYPRTGKPAGNSRRKNVDKTSAQSQHHSTARLQQGNEHRKDQPTDSEQQQFRFDF